MFFSLEVQSPLLLNPGMNDKKHIRGGDVKCSSDQLWPVAGSAQVQEVLQNLLHTAVFENHAYGIAMKLLQRGEKEAMKSSIGKENVSIFKHLMWTAAEYPSRLGFCCHFCLPLTAMN